MRKLIDAALARSRAVTVVVLTILVLGGLSLVRIPMDILPVYNSPAVQTLTFYSGMPAESIASGITNPMERMTGQAAGMRRQESRSILGASIVRNYFHDNIDPNGALTQVNSLALGEIPNLPPGTLPPVVLPYDPTGTVPVCLIAVDSKTWGESTLYDVGRYEVRNYVMSSPGTNAPLSTAARFEPLLPRSIRPSCTPGGCRSATFSGRFPSSTCSCPPATPRLAARTTPSAPTRCTSCRSAWATSRCATGPATPISLVTWPRSATVTSSRCARCASMAGPRYIIPVYRQQGASTLEVVDHLKEVLPAMKTKLSKPDIDLKLVMDQSVYVRQSIKSLAIEGTLGAVLCSLVILVFLGEWRMTAIAVLLIPLAVLTAIVGLYAFGQTINVMTLAGLALAIGPLVDIAIVCLENTHRHLGSGRAARGRPGRRQRSHHARTGGDL